MRRIIVLCICISSFSAVLAQTTEQQKREQAAKQQVIQNICKAPEVTSGSEFEELQRIKTRLARIVNQDQQHRTYLALVNSPVINAWAANLSMTNSLICVPVAMVHFMGHEGELAFILSHEIGHTMDDQCKTQEGRLAIAKSRGSLGAFLGGLLGGQQGAASGSQISQQRGCEARADEIGFAIFTASGYNPYDAAGAFGRIEMYLGDTSTGLLSRLGALGNDHPMTPDRIKHMRSLLMNHTFKGETGD